MFVLLFVRKIVIQSQQIHEFTQENSSSLKPNSGGAQDALHGMFLKIKAKERW